MENSSKRKFILLVFLCWLGYTTATFGRINMSANTVNFTNGLGISKTEFGTVGACFAIFYGIGQLVNGLFCEKLNSKKVLSIALILTGVISLIVGFVKERIFLCVLWGLNGAVQSMLWCHVIKLTSTLGDSKKIAKALMIITTTTPLGTFLSYGFSALFTFIGVWQAVFLLSGVLLVLSGALVFCLLPSFNGARQIEEENKEKKFSFRSFLPCLLPVFACAVMINYVYHGLTNWMPNLLAEYHSMPDYFSILLTMLLPVVGMVCGITAVKASEKIGNSLVVSIIFAFISMVGIGLSLFVVKSSTAILIVGFLIGSFAVHVNNSVFTAVFPADMRKYLGSGMLAGVIDAFCYLGTAFSSQIPPVLIEWGGYEAVLISMLVVSVVFIVVCAVGNYLIKKKTNT